MKIAVYECFGIVKNDEELKQIASKPLSNFLTESLNLELINIILIGIENFSDTSNTERNLKQGQKKPNIDIDFQNIDVRMLILDKITLDRADKWDPANSNVVRNISGMRSKSEHSKMELNIYENIKVYDYAYQCFN